MRILIVTPAPAGSRQGNRITALRWARLLRELGHRVEIRQQYRGAACDVLVALHARRSFTSVARFRHERPGAPLVLALTGTDLYQDLPDDPLARQAIELADRLIVLQPLATQALPEEARERARVIYQSVPPIRRPGAPRADAFEVCVLGHLRPVKDPLRTARAARLLPPCSRLRVVHVGRALSRPLADAAQAEMAQNPRYRWLGELPRGSALRVLARSRLLCLTSRSEGGANVISEAVVAGVPVISSRIAGSVGLLGEDYPGYFSVGNTRALAALLLRAETDGAFYEDLRHRCGALAPRFAPAREREAWRFLLQELGVT